MKTCFSRSALIAVVCLLSDRPAFGLEVTLDAGGSGSATFTDTDLDGMIDFDETVGSVFRAKGRVKENLGPITKSVTIAATPPESEAIFRNLGAGMATFTVTVTTSSFPPTGAPLGWSVAYMGDAGDPLGGPVDIPSHSVTASVNAASVLLTTLSGPPISAATEIELEASGSNGTASAADVTIVFSFAPGPNDEIRLPQNEGFDNRSIQVDVFNQSKLCVDRMNNRARQLAKVAGHRDSWCVLRGTGNVTACVDDTLEPKTVLREQKLLRDFETRCAPLPPFGVQGASCCQGGADDGETCIDSLDCLGGTCTAGACISAAAQAAAGAITHDIFGGTVNVASDDKAALCQTRVIQRADKLHRARWNAFRRCKKSNFALISNDADLVDVCLGPPQTDPRGYISRQVAMLSDAVLSACVRSDITLLDSHFPGLCAPVPAGSFANCVAARVACRFCQAVNKADDIVPALNCDAFDDGASNASCTP